MIVTTPLPVETQRRIREAVETKATELDLSEQGLSTFPAELLKLSWLKTLDLSGNALVEVPQGIAQLAALEFLDLSRNRLVQVPETLCELSSLKTLSLYANQLTNLPNCIATLAALDSLLIVENPMRPVALLLAMQRQLRKLYVDFSWLKEALEQNATFSALDILGVRLDAETGGIDVRVAALRTVTDLTLISFTDLEPWVSELTQLQQLDVSGNQLSVLPDSLGALTQLQQLYVSNNQLSVLPESLGALNQLQQLDVSGNQLSVLPESLGALTQLQQLDVSGNQLSVLPESLGALTQLQQLNVWRNQLSVLPESLGALTQLQKLNVWDNQLSVLPESLGALTQLQKLNVSRNQLSALPESLGALTQLQQLDVSRNQLSVLPESLGALTQLQQLDVWGNQLSTLPESLGALTQLQQLNVGGNQLSTLPESLGALTQLQQLDVWGNQLSVLPDSLGALTQLQQLFVYHNQLSTLPESLDALTQLQQLNVGGNQLIVLPDSLGALTQLKQLSVWGNQLIVLPDSLSALTQLQGLYVSNNQLSILPVSLGALPQLQQLYVSNNQLSVLPDSLGALTQLQQLNVGGNQLSVLPESLGALTQLQQLDVSGNQLSVLPESLGALTQLQQLDVSGNQLSVLPESLGALTQLQQLDVSGNQLSALPERIGAIESLKDLDVSDNRLSSLPQSLRNRVLDWLMVQRNSKLGIPDSIAGKHVEIFDRPEGEARKRCTAILAHYFRSRDLDGKPLGEVKLLLVGRGEGGKTAIVRALKGMKFARTKETEGIDIHRWQLACDGLDVRVNIWDFAGQVITHATHQFFMTERSAYVLVLTGRGDLQKADADRWLRMIQAFGTDADGRTSPVIVALNKWDGHPFKLDRNGIREKYPFVLGFVETDCKSGLGINELRSGLQAIIANMESVRQPFPLAWWTVKEAIEKAQKRHNYLSFSDFRALCAKSGEDSEEEQQVLSTVFHALGIALNYGSDERLRDATVLNPRWVTEGIYKLLRHAVEDDGSGVMDLRKVDEALPREPEHMRRYLVELMRRFKLAFPLNEAGDRWLVPQRLPEEQPILEGDWSGDNATRLRYRYVVLPEGLMPNFITRTYPLSEGDDEGSALPRWVNGVVLADQGARALVKADPEEREIRVTVLGDTDARRRLLGVIRSDLDDIHDQIAGLNPTVEIELAGKSNAWVAIDTLEADEKQRQGSSAQTPQGTVPVDNVQELNRLSLPAARDPSQWRARVFISYSSSDAKQMDELQTRLKPLNTSEGLIAVWNDRCINPGADWDGEIRKELDSSDVILLLLSAKFLASDYIRGVEIQRAVELASQGKSLLVPIVLEECGWTTESFGRFNALPRKGKPIRDERPQRNAWEAVRQELQALITHMRDERRRHASSDEQSSGALRVR